MALTPQELHVEELGQLRRLVQSPAWSLFKVRVQKRVEFKDLEKARHLREGRLQEAAVVQAQVDGLRESMDLIHQYMEGLEEELRVPEPAY